MHRFIEAFNAASKAYCRHRFNVRAGKNYFSDALQFYLLNDPPYCFRFYVENNETVIYRYNYPYKTTIQWEGKPLHLQFQGYNLQQVSLETFILALNKAQNKFPKIKEFVEFPPSAKNPIQFPEVKFQLNYPTDVSRIRRFSYDINYLLNWLQNVNIDTGNKIAFVFGYDSGIQKTLATYLMEDILPQQLHRYLEPYYTSIKGSISDNLLRYLRTRELSTLSRIGNYSLQVGDFSDILNVTSDLKFVNPGRVVVNDPIPQVTLPEVRDQQKLGEGSYGEVYELDGFAYKRVSIDFEAEMQGLTLVNRHVQNFNNIVKVIEYDGQKRIFKMEKLIPLPKRVNPFLPQNGNIPIFLQMIQGLYALHSVGLAHNDIKTANVMQTDNGQVKLIDFGLVTVYCTKLNRMFPGTYVYNPPEFYADEDDFINDPQWIKLMPAHDIWSAVLVAYEIVIGYHVYEYFDLDEVSVDKFVGGLSLHYGNENVYNLQTIDFSHVSKLFDWIGDDPDMFAILRRCLDPNPFTRATASEILQSPYAQKYLNFVPEIMPPCRRMQIIDGNPFAGYRTRKERENWIVFCDHFGIPGVQYAPMFECAKLPKDLCYMDYLAILGSITNVIYDVEYISLPHPVPLTISYSYNLKEMFYEYHFLLKGVAKLQLFDDHRRHEEIVKIVTQGYLDGKCSTMSVLELLAE